MEGEERKLPKETSRLVRMGAIPVPCLICCNTKYILVKLTWPTK